MEEIAELLPQNCVITSGVHVDGISKEQIDGVASLIVIGPISIALQNLLSSAVMWLLNLNIGIAVIPSDGKVYAPEDAIVRVAHPTGHAVGLAGTAGDELLIHIGVDTINLNGQYFTSHVEQGMKVKKVTFLLNLTLMALKKQVMTQQFWSLLPRLNN